MICLKFLTTFLFFSTSLTKISIKRELFNCDLKANERKLYQKKYLKKKIQ